MPNAARWAACSGAARPRAHRCASIWPRSMPCCATMAWPIRCALRSKCSMARSPTGARRGASNCKSGKICAPPFWSRVWHRCWPMAGAWVYSSAWPAAMPIWPRACARRCSACWPGCPRLRWRVRSWPLRCWAMHMRSMPVGRWPAWCWRRCGAACWTPRNWKPNSRAKANGKKRRAKSGLLQACWSMNWRGRCCF